MRTANRAIAFCCGVLSLLFALLVLAGPNSAVAQAHPPSKPAKVSVTVSPPKATVFAGETQVFVATVVGESDGTVTWSVDEEEGGRVTSQGLYTAPKIQGMYHVTATSVANPQKRGAATVTVIVYCDPRGASMRP